jgi:hypothetical protein
VELVQLLEWQRKFGLPMASALSKRIEEDAKLNGYSLRSPVPERIFERDALKETG